MKAKLYEDPSNIILMVFTSEDIYNEQYLINTDESNFNRDLKMA